MKKMLTMLGLAFVTVASVAGADDAKQTEQKAEKAISPNPPIGTKPYGLAGCGLGAVFFDDRLPVLAATTNDTFGNQTFGITSGTSHCSDTAPSTASTKVFIEANRTALAKEIARGKGETLDNLSALAGCSDAKAVGAKLQKSFKTIFPNQKASDADVSTAIVNTLQSDTTLACGALTTG